MITYFLVDLENIQQPRFPEKLPKDAQVWVFVGHNQTKVPLDLVEQLQGLGERARYIRATSGGSNALDFHIACYLGRLSISEPNAQFIVVSGDTGFDPLITHLRSLRINVTRSPCSAQQKSMAKPAAAPKPATAPKPAAAPTPAAAPKSAAAAQSVHASPPATGTRAEISQWELVERAFRSFGGMNSGRPKSVPAFRNVVLKLARQSLPEDSMEELLHIFIQRGVVVQDGEMLIWGDSQKFAAALH